MKRLVAVALMSAAGATVRASAREASTPAPPPKLFAVVFRTGPGWDKSLPPPQQKNFKEHSENIARMRSEGRLKLGGRFGEWGLILIEA
ncbi:MAG TPA: hypothetical protein VIC87_18340, partial [Vicinamibacteria bacterium]